MAAGALVFGAWWIGRIIQPRDLSQRAAKDLIIRFCGDSLESLSRLSELIDTSCATAGETLADSVRISVMRGLTGFSNALLTVDEAVTHSGISLANTSLADLRTLRDELRSQISEPLVAPGTFDSIQIRQIHAAILKARLALIRFELGIVKIF